MRSKKGMKVTALACALGLVAVACGDDDSEESTATTTAGAATTSGGAATTAGGATTTSGGATTTAGGATTTSGGTATSAGAATTSAAAGGGATTDNPAGFNTSKLTGPGPYGQDPSNDQLYKGAGDFQIDLADCPSDYDPVQGISDTEIKLATSVPKSGGFAGFGLIADGMISYFDYVNDTYGGVDGRKITLDVKDDNYEPSRTKTNVDEMLQSGDYAAFVTVLGTPNNLGVWDELNKECMPQLLNATGSIQWGDVQNHPWTTGMQIDYYSEAQLWKQWIDSEFPNGANVATISYNNDFGQQYVKGFNKAIEGTNIKVVAEQTHEANAPNLTNQFTSLAASNADVLIVMTSGSFCTQSMAEIDRGSWKPKVMVSATCSSLSQFFQPLIDQGLNGNGTYILQYFKDPNDVAFADDPIVKLFKEAAQKEGLDPRQTTYFTGWIYAWFMTEFLNVASTLPGGLNRPNILIANRSINTRMPAIFEGLQNKMEGLKDAYLNEGARVAQYQVTDPKVLGTYVGVSDIFNNEGKLGTYQDIAG